jgi:hypothetical protein
MKKGTQTPMRYKLRFGACTRALFISLATMPAKGLSGIARNVIHHASDAAASRELD